MSVSTEGRRIIIVGNRKYIWYIAPDVITPRFVEQMIIWSTQITDAISRESTGVPV